MYFSFHPSPLNKNFFYSCSPFAKRGEPAVLSTPSSGLNYTSYVQVTESMNACSTCMCKPVQTFDSTNQPDD